MAHLIRMPRAAWRRQPQGPVQINQNYNGVVSSAYILNSLTPRDIAKNTNPATVFSPNSSNQLTLRSLSSGVGAYNFSGANNSDVVLLDAIGAVPVGWALLQFVFLGVGATYYQVYFCHSDSPGGNRLYFGTSPTAFFIRLGSGVSQTVGYISTGTVHTVAIRWASGVIYCFADGVQLANRVYAGTPGSLSAYTTLLGNTNLVDSTDCANGGLFLCAFGKTAVSDAFLIEITKNPWQLFQPSPARFILIPSSGSATAHDAALTLAYIAAFNPAASAQFNAGLTLATLAGALSGKTAQFNTALSLETNVSLTLAKALSTLATVQLDMTAGQSVSALNDAVAAITESIACSYTSSVTANLLASLSFGITQALISGTGGQLAAALTLALNASTQASATATYSADVFLLTTLQTALQSALSMTASLTLPATLTITIDGVRISDGDVSLALAMQAGMTTSATAILSAQLTLATHLLATPSGAASFQTAMAIANTLSTSFTTGNAIQSALSLAVSLALADAASVSIGGSLSLGLVLNDLQSAIASLNATAEFPLTLDVPLSGGMAMEAGISLGWTLSMSSNGAFFEITVTMPTGRVVMIQASERLLNISASERLIMIPPNDSLISIH